MQPDDENAADPDRARPPGDALAEGAGQLEASPHAAVGSPVSRRHRLGIGAAIAILVLAAAVTVGIGILRGATSPTDTVRVDAAPTISASASAASLYVHVAGAVRDPGLYALPPGARLIDALTAAGGFSTGAQQDGVNLARPVSDGEQIVVPAAGAVPAAGGATPASTSAVPAGGRVNLNTADEAALETLPRIGPAMAQRIVQWRDKNGRFTSVEDLLAVPGIGDKMLESLRDLVTV